MALLGTEAQSNVIAPDPNRTALIVIDMQRDFLEPGGFGDLLGNDVSLLTPVVDRVESLLMLARCKNMLIAHTREGHLPDLSDLPDSKYYQLPEGSRIGDVGPMARVLIRGEPGHDIIPRLSPRGDELVIDKPGKGAFYKTTLELQLRRRAIDTLILCGVTTEVCVSSTIREASDRGFMCLVVADACGSYAPELHESALEMVAAQGGIFGRVTTSDSLNNAFLGDT